jgi:hypothetical protein
MTEQTGTTHANSAAAESVPADGGQAAAPPCGCGERITTVEQHLAGLERIARAASYLSMIAAAAVLYLLWAGSGAGKGEAAP